MGCRPGCPKDPETGKRRQKWHRFKGSKPEVEQYLTELIYEAQHQNTLIDKRLLMSTHLENWLLSKENTVVYTAMPTTAS